VSYAFCPISALDGTSENLSVIFTFREDHENVRYLCLVLRAVETLLQLMLVVRLQVGKVEIARLFTAGHWARDVFQIQRLTLRTDVHTISLTFVVVARCNLWR